MKVLISAFACRPNRGSEPGVGWNWSKNLSYLNEVYVYTREVNRLEIESSSEYKYSNVKFHYHELPKLLSILNNFKFGIYLYYLAWQFTLVFKAKKLHYKIRFDLCHHITYASFRFPSMLYKLGIPFIFGPVGGGEVSPKNLYCTFLFPERVKEYLRVLYTKFTKYNLLTYKTWKNADLIIVTTDETKERIPDKFKNKVLIMQTIGINNSESMEKESEVYETFKILFTGRLLQWKGVNLIPVIAERITKHLDNFEFIIIGDGPEKNSLISKVDKLSLSN